MFGKGLQPLIFLVVHLLFSVWGNHTRAQSVPYTEDTQLRASVPPMPNWYSVAGTPDTSDSSSWGFLATPWIGGPYPTPTGDSYFMSAGNFISGGEAAQSLIAGLTIGEEYTVVFHVAGFRSTNSSTSAIGNSYRIVVGNEDSGSVPFNSNGWLQQTFNFTADASFEFITFYGQTTGSSTALTHFSMDSVVSSTGDNDGVSNAIDLDDDNDGILDVDENNNCTGPTINTVFINEDFGTGNRTSSPYTNYCYESGYGTDPCSPLPGDPGINDGEYAILQFTTPQSVATGAANFTEWISIGDHTGNANGRMAVYNAALVAGEFYNRPISGVVPNVTMQLSFWGLNPVKSGTGYILPNVTFEIRDLSNNLVTTGNTGNIPENETWNNYTFSFDPGNNTSLRLIMINNSIGGAGNDLAIDDIVLAQLFCDSDADGIINQYDLDSDNDGIYDLVESGALNNPGVTDTNNDGIIDGPPSSFGTNGFHSSLENNDTFSAVVTYTYSDSDSDGNMDSYELDSENDGCFDVVEGGFTDLDADGILGSAPVSTDIKGVVTSGTDGYSTPADLDTNGVYEFQEVLTYTLTHTDVTVNGGSDGTFTLQGLTPNATYTLTYIDDGIPVPPGIYVSNGTGQITVSGLDAGSYTQIRVSLGVCPGPSLTVTIEEPLMAPAPPIPGGTYCKPPNIPNICTYNASNLPATSVTVSAGQSICIDTNFTYNGSILLENGAKLYVSEGANFGVNGSLSTDLGSEIILTECASFSVFGSYLISGGEINAYCDLQTTTETINVINGGGSPTCNAASTYCPISGFFGSSTGTLNLTINPCTVTSGDVVECEEDPIQTLTAVATPPPGSNMVWYDAASGGNLVVNPILNMVGTVTYYGESVDQISGLSSLTRTPVTLTIEASPEITAQVTDRQSFDGNLSISFTVGATGSNLLYQWQVSTDGGTTYTDLVNGPHYTDVQTATLLIQGGITLADDGHLFRVVLSNGANVCSDLLSDSGLLTVGVRSVITNRRITTRVKKN